MKTRTQVRPPRRVLVFRQPGRPESLQSAVRSLSASELTEAKRVLRLLDAMTPEDRRLVLTLVEQLADVARQEAPAEGGLRTGQP